MSTSEPNTKSGTAQRYFDLIKALLGQDGNVEEALRNINGGIEFIEMMNVSKNLLYIGRYEYDGSETFLLVDNKSGKFYGFKRTSPPIQKNKDI
jgi:hypothetical protein